MKVYCTNNQDGYCKLTIGKDYEILEETDSSYLVLNDKKEAKSYLKNKFVDSKEKLNNVMDRLSNPNKYYNPIELILNIKDRSVEIQSIKIDEELLGIDNIQEFLNIKPLYGIKICSKYKYPNIYSGHCDLGNKKEIDLVTSFNFTSNRVAIEFVYNLNKEIDHINENLINVKKEMKMIYLIEHEPNGKQYAFRSDKELYIGELVICDTNKGEQYGVVKGTSYENICTYMKRKTCKRIEK